MSFSMELGMQLSVIFMLSGGGGGALFAAVIGVLAFFSVVATVWQFPIVGVLHSGRIFGRKKKAKESVSCRISEQLLRFVGRGR